MGGAGFRNLSLYPSGKNPTTVHAEWLASKRKRSSDKRRHVYIWRYRGFHDTYPSHQDILKLEQLLLNYVGLNKDRINKIDGGRYEVHVPSSDEMASTEHGQDIGTFKRLASVTLQNEVRKYVHWANSTARERVVLNVREIGDFAAGYIFENHSFLISYDENTRAQVPHIDLKGGKNLVQVASYLTHNTTPTLVDPTRVRVNPLQACNNLGLSNEQASALMAISLDALKEYGDLSLPKNEIDDRMKSSKTCKLVPAGSMSACLGGIIHSGPASSGQRVVLFFVGRPHDSTERYDSDYQVKAWTLPSALADDAERANNTELADVLKKVAITRSIDWSSTEVKPHESFHNGRSLDSLGTKVQRVLKACK